MWSVQRPDCRSDSDLFRTGHRSSGGSWGSEVGPPIGLVLVDILRFFVGLFSHFLSVNARIQCFPAGHCIVSG